MSSHINSKSWTQVTKFLEMCLFYSSKRRLVFWCIQMVIGSGNFCLSPRSCTQMFERVVNISDFQDRPVSDFTLWLSPGFLSNVKQKFDEFSENQQKKIRFLHVSMNSCSVNTGRWFIVHPTHFVFFSFCWWAFSTSASKFKAQIENAQKNSVTINQAIHYFFSVENIKCSVMSITS